MCFHAEIIVISIDVSVTNVGLILTKLKGWFLFSGSGQTDRQTRFRNPHMETSRHTNNFNSKLKIKSIAVDRYSLCIPGWRGCIHRIYEVNWSKCYVTDFTNSWSESEINSWSKWEMLLISQNASTIWKIIRYVKYQHYII